ncbi:MAG: hypothetical protein R3F43_09400 [bacterium]
MTSSGPLGGSPGQFAANDIWSSTQLHAGCLARTGPRQEADAVSSLRNLDGRVVRVIEALGECRARQHRAWDRRDVAGPAAGGGAASA